LRIVITLDESLTVGACIEDVSTPNQSQSLALRDLSVLAGLLRRSLLYHPTNDFPDYDPETKQMKCLNCGEMVPEEDAYRDSVRPFHWTAGGGGHTMEHLSSLDD
jgi:hypothetical protein